MASDSSPVPSDSGATVTRITPVAAERGRRLFTLEARGAVARVALEGAQVLSFTPAGALDVLWASPVWPDVPTPIRGGVPICWPWFARQDVAASAPQHGYARQAPWKIVDERVDAAGGHAAVTMTPEQPLDGLALRLEIALDGSAGALSMRLTTTNPAGGAERTITQALHNYFAVTDANRLSLLGLGGQRYIDNLAGQVERTASDPEPVVLPCERIHFGTNGRYVLDDPAGARRILIESEGSRSLVVWHPGVHAAQRYEEVPGDHWQRFVCCEVANAAPDRIRLAPGASHTIAQRVRVLDGNGRQ